MGTTLRYLAVGDEQTLVSTWFEAVRPAPVKVPGDGGTLLYFREFGPLAYSNEGEIDPGTSPLVTLIPVKVRRGVLWTAGEVHFLTARIRDRYPDLDRVRREFRAWLEQYELVYDGRPGEWDYFLEGSIRNDSTPLYAFPNALEALRQGMYFVGDDDNPQLLDTICRQLALRGVECEPEAEG